MPLEREKQGLNIEEYKKELTNGTKSLRIGKEVPEGDVNLGYIHTPKIQVDENVSLTDTSYTADNVIPQDQLESIVVANDQGELEYVDMISEGEVQVKPPGNTFPSDTLNITRKFKKDHIQTEDALYYKFEINYHYDSKKAIPDRNGEFLFEKYTGQQIEITDENGYILSDSYKYDIYVKAHPLNPRIYKVQIYLHSNTNETNTIKVRYNHIDDVVQDEHVHSVENQIEFYTGKDNKIMVNNQQRQMLEGGKLRIINGEGTFQEKNENEIYDAMMNNEFDKEIYAIIPKENGEGYRIIVPQRSESDPRTPRIFSHRLIATYEDTNGQEVKVSVGHITDWCLNSEALLQEEKKEYDGEWKHIGLSINEAKLNAKEMIELSLPFGTPSIPSDATFSIEDDKGNLLYHVVTMRDNPDVSTQVNEVISNTPQAKANDLEESPWNNAMQSNAMVKNNPIPHRASIIPERQKTKWEFEWKADGQGHTEEKTNYKTTWQVCANVGFKKTIKPQTLDVLDKRKWDVLGSEAHVNDWRYSYVSSMQTNIIEYLNNPMDITGFFQREEKINGETVNIMNKTDYQFSTKVRLTDPIDDDLIGVIFRVQNSQNYYMFAWEKNELATKPLKYESDHGEGIIGATNGMGRVVLDEFGLGVRGLNQEGVNKETWRWTSDKNKYLNEWGFGNKHARLFRATPSEKSPSPNPEDKETWDGETRYPDDKTNCAFTDITDFNKTYNPKGWEYNKDYKITVVVTGSLFRIYINDNIDSEDLGQLVCEGVDSVHTKGSYGIFCASQRWTYWYDLEMTEIEMDTVCTEKTDVVLTDTKERKLSNYTVTDMMQPLIEYKAEHEYHNAPYEVFDYYPRSDGDFSFRIDERTDFLYGKTNNPAAGGIVRREWTTSENGLTVEGRGRVEYHADGHFTIVATPPLLPTNQIPDNVLGFQWHNPVITSGDNVSISLVNGEQVKVAADIPPIEIVGRPYVLSEKEILKTDGLQHMEYLFSTNEETGFYEKLGIAEGIPLDEILLRIERGEVTGVESDGSATTVNPEYRVNYRFRCERDGFTRLPVDQFQDQLGVNRIRLKSLMNDDGDLDSSILVDIVAWTTFQELEAVPLFAVKIEEQKKIEIEKPKVEERYAELSNWYLRIKKGQFLKRIQLPYHEESSTEKVPEIYIAYPELLGMVKKPDEIVEVDLEYSLPEYVNQEFHNKPHIQIEKEKPMILNEYQIQTRYAPLVLDTVSGYSSIEVFVIRAEEKKSLRVADIDKVKGIIYLHDRIKEQDNVYVNYLYSEKWYTYRGFLKQNRHDLSALSQKVFMPKAMAEGALESNFSNGIAVKAGLPEYVFFHLDLNPTPGHQHTIAKNGFHHWIPIDNDQESISLQQRENKELLVKQIHVYLRPMQIRYVDQNDPSKHGNIIEGTKRDYTVFHTDEDWWFSPKDYRYDPTMLRLGKITLQANSTIEENMTVLDTRTRGGGLDESITKDIIERVNKESLYHWDIGYFDGEAYQENGIMIIRVPYSVLKSEENPNGFHESEVEAIVSRHKAYGVLPIIEYYEEKTEVSQYNILHNHEFLNGKDIGYHDPYRSSGDYALKQMRLGSGDNHVLQIKDEAEYAITIPGYQFTCNQYELHIKALKEQIAPERSAGQIEVFYKDGVQETIQLSNINRDQWMVYKESFEIESERIHHVTITLNKTSENRSGNIIYDYVILKPNPKLFEENTEIHEI